MKKESRCRICSDPVPDILKQFDPHLGYICPGCAVFLAYAARRLRAAGIEGVTEKQKP